MINSTSFRLIGVELKLHLCTPDYDPTIWHLSSEGANIVDVVPPRPILYVAAVRDTKLIAIIMTRIPTIGQKLDRNPTVELLRSALGRKHEAVDEFFWYLAFWC